MSGGSATGFAAGAEVAQLAGELGLLLKIEEHLASAIEKARKAWTASEVVVVASPLPRERGHRPRHEVLARCGLGGARPPGAHRDGAVPDLH